MWTIELNPAENSGWHCRTVPIKMGSIDQGCELLIIACYRWDECKGLETLIGIWQNNFMPIESYNKRFRLYLYVSF